MMVKKILKNYLIPILIGILIAVGIKTFVFTLINVSGSSMYPNLYNAEKVGVLKTVHPHRNSVVVFNANGVDTTQVVAPHTYYVKRIIGIPGDRIQYTKNGQLYINGHLQSQSYITKKQRIAGTLSPLKKVKSGFTLASLSRGSHWKKVITKIPKNYYFVLGDNREISNDSRYWGLVPSSKIMGVVKVPFWNAYATKIN